VGELKTAEVLESQGIIVFRDWTKHVTDNGFDLIAFDKASKKVWFIDNKAQIRGIGKADALSGPQFDTNRTAAKEFLASTSPHPEAADALAAIEREDFIKVVSNAWATESTTFTQTMMSKGLAVYDVRVRQLFTNYAEWKLAFAGMSRIVRRVGMRGSVSVKGMLMIVVVAGGILYAMRSGASVSSALGELAAELSLGAVLSRLPGGFFAGMVLGLESDESPAALAARKRKETIDQLMWSLPSLEGLTDADQQLARAEIARLIDDPWKIDIPSPPAPKKQLLPGLTSPLDSTDWA
jgi:hypothetical protein